MDREVFVRMLEGLRFRIYGTVAGAVLMLATPASAASQADRDQCADVGDRAATDRNIAACTRILDDRSDPNQTAALGNRCRLWIAKGNLDRAIADCDEAIRRDPKDANVYVDRGNAHAARRDFDRAIADFDAAIGLNPALAMAYNNRGVAWRNKGDLARAVADYSEAIRLAPSLALAWRNRGRARTRDEFDAAIADFDAAIRLDPNDAGSFGSRCWARAVAGRDLGQALADCDESLRLRPGDSETLNSRGLVQLKQAAFDRAAADYAAAVAQDGRDADSLFGRGIARVRLGDRAGGEADIAAAVAIRRGIADDYVGYGVMTASASQTAPGAPAQRDYQLAAQIGTRAAFEAFLKQYPSGFHADLARAQLAKLGVATTEATGTIDRDKAAPEQKDQDRLVREQAKREKSTAPVQTAVLAPAPPTVAAQPSPSLSGGALVEAIKKGLAQVGCYAGPIDDKWKSASTRSAVKKFVAAVHLATATEKPTQGLLDAVRSSTGQVCAPACGAGEVKRKGECVAKTCPGKQVLDADGKCARPDVKRAALPSAAGPAPHAAAPGPAKKK